MKKIIAFLFSNKNTRQTVAKNVTWLFIGEFGSRALKMIISIYAARLLGTTQWGVFSYALAFMGIFSLFSDVGINAVLLRETAKERDVDSITVTGFFIKCVLSIISVGLMVGMIFVFHATGNRTILLYSAALLFFESMREFGFSINRAHEKMEREALNKIISNIILVGLGFIFLVKFDTALSFMWAYVGASVIGFLFLFLSIHSYLHNSKTNFRKELIVPIFREAWPIAIMAVFNTIILSIDTVMLGWFRTSQDVGLFTAPQKIIQFLYLVPSLMSTALLPLFARLHMIDTDKTKIVLGKTITLSFALLLPITLFGMILAPSIIISVFGIEYAQSALVFRILLCTIIIGAGNAILSDALFAIGKQRTTMRFIGIGAVCNIILSLVLIPLYGFIGAAIANTAALLVCSTTIFISARSIPQLRFTLHLKRILIATVISLLVIFFLQTYFSLVPLLCIYGILYLGLLFLFKEPLIDEMRSLVHID